MKKIMIILLLFVVAISAFAVNEGKELTKRAEPLAERTILPVNVQNAIDQNLTFSVSREARGLVTIDLTCDFYPEEATWNIWNIDIGSYYYNTNQGFTTAYENVLIELILDDGDYQIHCWDTYGDGGIGGQVIDGGGTVLVMWTNNDYLDYGEYAFNTVSYDDNLAAVTVTGSDTPIQNALSIYTVTVRNVGSNTQSVYTVKLMKEGDIELDSADGVELSQYETADFELEWTSMVLEETYIWGEVVFEDQNSEDNLTAQLNVIVQPEGTIAVAVGDGTELQKQHPVNYYWKNALSEQIFYAEELNVNGTLSALEFTYNFTQMPEVTDFNLWIGETELTDLSAGFIPSTALQHVYSGSPEFVLGDGVLHIELDNFYEYNGGNLVMLAHRPMDTTYCGPCNYYSTTDESHPNRSVEKHSDSVVFDPTVAYTDGNLGNQHCNTVFFFLATGGGSLTGIVTSEGLPIEGATVVIEDTPLTTTTDADGMYYFDYVEEGTYSVIASKHGYEDATVTDVVIVDGIETVADIVMTPLASVNVTGTVVGSDAPETGIEGAIVTLTGFEDYEVITTAGGDFLIEGVYTNNTYDVEITAYGYEIYTGVAEVLGDDLDLGIITLLEVYTPPFYVIAIPNEDNTEVDLTWTEPGSGDLYELNQHDNITAYGYVQSFDNGYGVIYDLSSYSYVTLEMVDFRHSSWDISGIWDYKIHIVDWDTYTELAVVEGLQTTGDDQWEEGVELGAVPASGLVGIFMEPCGNTADFAFPTIDWDTALDGASFFGALSDYSAMSAAGGDFLMDLWIMGAESGRSVRAQRVSVNATNQTEMNHVATDVSRSLESYNVYRFNVEDINTPELWDYLATTTDTTYYDADFGTLETGFYQYAVTAVYTYNIESEPTISNEVEKVAVSADDNSVTGITKLGKNYPNPFNPETTISFSIKEDVDVSLEIYNIKGQKVKTLLDDNMQAGIHSVVWNGKDDSNKSVSSGVYFYKMKTDNHEETKKMILMK